MKALVVSTILFAGGGAGADTAQDFGKVEVKIDRLTPSIAMLEGAGGNIGVSFGEDGVLLIDDEFAPLHAKIKAAVATLSKKPVRFVFNTHWHGDHTGDNENLGAEGTTIVAHDNVYQRLSTAQKKPMAPTTTLPSQPHAALPVISFDHELTFHVNGDTARVIHVEHAHTDGDSIVVFEKANVVHMGDTFFSNGYPFIDVGSGGSIDGVIEATERVLAMIDDKTQVMPGHGPVANKARLVDYHDMLKAIRAQVAVLKKQKKTLAQVVAAKPTATWDAVWNHGYEKSDELLDAIYASVGK